MNITCIICHDRLEKADEIYFTRCGHVFHFGCLTQWLNRSQTCPQCRERTPRTNIFKAYFNLENEVVPTNTSMQVSINKLKSQIFAKNKSIKLYITKIASLEKQKTDLSQKVQRLELETNDAKSNILNLQSRIDYLERLCSKKEALLQKYPEHSIKLRMHTRMALDVAFEENRGILKDILEQKKIPPIMFNNVFNEGTKYFNVKTEDKSEKLIYNNTQFNNEGIVDIKDIPLVHKVNTETEIENNPSSSKTEMKEVSNENRLLCRNRRTRRFPRRAHLNGLSCNEI